jgi:hypothetical protein
MGTEGEAGGWQIRDETAMQKKPEFCSSKDKEWTAVGGGREPDIN